MCGLFGIVAGDGCSDFSSELKVLGVMLAAYNTERGNQSHGIWDGTGRIIRRIGKPFSADNNANTFKFIKDWEIKPGAFIAGHTRFATAGEITKENQHPFDYRGMRLAHNGCVDVDGYDDNDHAVDSGRIAMALVDHGYEEGFKKIKGSCGLIFQVQDALYIYRANQVLHLAVGPWGWAISSAKPHLEGSLLCAGLKWDSLAEIPEYHCLAPWLAEPLDVVFRTAAVGRPPRNYYDRDNFGQTTSLNNSDVYSRGYNYTTHTEQTVKCDVCGRNHTRTVSSKFVLDIDEHPKLVEKLKSEGKTGYHWSGRFIYDVCNTCLDSIMYTQVFKYLKVQTASSYWESYIKKHDPVVLAANGEPLHETYIGGRYCAFLKTGLLEYQATKRSPLLWSREMEMVGLTMKEVEDLSTMAIEKNYQLFNDNSGKRRETKSGKPAAVVEKTEAAAKEAAKGAATGAATSQIPSTVPGQKPKVIVQKAGEPRPLMGLSSLN